MGYLTEWDNTVTFSKLCGISRIALMNYIDNFRVGKRTKRKILIGYNKVSDVFYEEIE